MINKLSPHTVIMNNGGPLKKVGKLTQDIRGLTLDDYDTSARAKR